MTSLSKNNLAIKLIIIGFVAFTAGAISTAAYARPLQKNIPVSLQDNVRFIIALPYALTDTLYEFERNGNAITLYTNCNLASGCNNFGFWTNPFPLAEISPGIYTITFNTSTVINTYKFVPQSAGDIQVSASHDQCYPSGCQNPPLQVIGSFKAK